MAVLYVASLGEGAGKTALCVSLASEAAARGAKAALFKPLAGQGLSPSADPDAGIYARLLGQTVEGWPVDMESDGLDEDTLGRIAAAFAPVSASADSVIVEGSYGLSDEETARLAEALDASVLIVAAYDDALSAASFAAWRERLGGRLAGVLVNGCTLHMAHEASSNLVPSLEAEGLNPLGLIPEDRRLLGVTVRQIADHLNGRFIACEERSHALVEHLMVGGLGMDSGEYYFSHRSDKAVIARGDRPDLHMSALATPTACIVLTKGIEPIEYVQYEAEAEEVSVMVVETDTLETMGAVGALIDRARFDHPSKVERYRTLLERHANLPALLRLVGA